MLFECNCFISLHLEPQELYRPLVASSALLHLQSIFAPLQTRYERNFVMVLTCLSITYKIGPNKSPQEFLNMLQSKTYGLWGRTILSNTPESSSLILPSPFRRVIQPSIPSTSHQGHLRLGWAGRRSFRGTVDFFRQK